MLCLRRSIYVSVSITSLSSLSSLSSPIVSLLPLSFPKFSLQQPFLLLQQPSEYVAFHSSPPSSPLSTLFRITLPVIFLLLLLLYPFYKSFFALLFSSLLYRRLYSYYHFFLSHVTSSFPQTNSSQPFQPTWQLKTNLPLPMGTRVRGQSDNAIGRCTTKYS